MASDQEMRAHERAIRTLQILAPKIKNDEQFEKKLATAPPYLRSIIYEICKPLLFFKAKSLEWYESQMRMRAEREQLPTIGSRPGEVVAFKSAVDLRTLEIANKALADTISSRNLVLTCGKCLIEHKFYQLEGENNNAVIRRARLAGWIYDYKSDPVRELCPECANG